MSIRRRRLIRVGAIGGSATAQLQQTLFGSGQQGAMYVPKPIVDGQQVLFQDSAGTTPVTADGQPVGLMLDLHKGLVKGPELVTNGTFDTDLSGWINTSGHWQWSNGRAYHPFASTYEEIKQLVSSESSVEIMFTIEHVQGEPNFIVDDFDGATLQFAQPTTPGVYNQRYIVKSSSAIRWARKSTNAEFYIDNISVREPPGNHATQTTAAAKPLYRTDGTLHWLEFDGVDDFIRSSAFARNQPSTASVALESYSTLSNNKYFDGLSNNTASLFSYTNGDLRWYSGSSFIHTSKISLNQKVIASCFFNSTNSIYGFNGVYENGDVGTANPSGAHIGNTPGGSGEWASMHFYGAVVESDATNSENLSHVDQYLAGLQGRIL